MAGNIITVQPYTSEAADFATDMGRPVSQDVTATPDLNIYKPVLREQLAEQVATILSQKRNEGEF